MRARFWYDGDMSYLFVYGTLMKGMRNAAYLEKVKFVGEAVTKPEFELMFNGSIPAARPGHESIKGELFEVDEATLKVLDVVEEVDANLYDRTEVEIDGKKAIMYLGGSRMFASDTWVKVPNGDYRALIQAAQKAP